MAFGLCLMTLRAHDAISTGMSSAHDNPDGEGRKEPHQGWGGLENLAAIPGSVAPVSSAFRPAEEIAEGEHAGQTT